MNLYGYAGGNPVNFPDPSGMDRWATFRAESLTREEEGFTVTGQRGIPTHDRADLSGFGLGQFQVDSDLDGARSKPVYSFAPLAAGATACASNALDQLTSAGGQAVTYDARRGARRQQLSLLGTSRMRARISERSPRPQRERR
jgi:hypothetical protein